MLPVHLFPSDTSLILFPHSQEKTPLSATIIYFHSLINERIFIFPGASFLVFSFMFKSKHDKLVTRNCTSSIKMSKINID